MLKSQDQKNPPKVLQAKKKIKLIPASVKVTVKGLENLDQLTKSV